MNSIMPYISYFGTATLLKIFSMNSLTKKAYRIISNKYFQSNHYNVSDIDFSRGLWLYKSINQTIPKQNNQRYQLLEIGTGWTHFYGLFLRHLMNIDLTLFDIRDNRQWDATKTRAKNLYSKLSELGPAAGIPTESLKYSKFIADCISNSGNFVQLYTNLKIKYFIESDGNLQNLDDQKFDVIFSVDVFEHIDSFALDQTISQIYGLLKPGGISIHQIGIDDHLTHYAKNMGAKEYLRYSDRTWKLFFENKLQYFNRKQASEYLKIFKNYNFTLLSEEYDYIDKDIRSYN